MNVVDSSGWLEYFADGPNADFFAPPIEDTINLIVPSISIYEVFKRVLIQRGEVEAIEKAALMAQGRVIDLDQTIAISAAVNSFDHKIPMADSIIYSTARQFDATLWTQDVDLAGLEGVKYAAKMLP